MINEVDPEPMPPSPEPMEVGDIDESTDGG